MQESIISLETAKLAKRKGFNIECLKFYTKPNSKIFGLDEHGRAYAIKNIPGKLYTVGNHVVLNIKNVFFAPTQSLLQKWLREVHELDILIVPTKKGYCTTILYVDENEKLQDIEIEGAYIKYEEALEASLYQALLLINE